MATDNPLSEAERIYADALAGLEPGQAADLDALCLAHPNLAKDQAAADQGMVSRYPCLGIASRRPVRRGAR